MDVERNANVFAGLCRNYNINISADFLSCVENSNPSVACDEISSSAPLSSNLKLMFDGNPTPLNQLVNFVDDVFDPEKPLSCEQAGFFLGAQSQSNNDNDA